MVHNFQKLLAENLEISTNNVREMLEAFHGMFLNLVKIALAVCSCPKSLIEVTFWHLVTEKVAV